MEEAMEYDIEEIPEPALQANLQGNNLPDVVVVSESEEEPEARTDAEPQAQAQNDNDDDDDDGEVVAKKGKLDLPEEPPAKPVCDDDDDDSDSGQMCPICMDLWSNSGEHRLCSLKCGHLFGHNCVLKWLQVACTAGNRRCPQCNRKAAVKDIRILYARKLSVVDTVEIEKLKRELDDVTKEKNRLEGEVSKCYLRQKLYEQQLSSMSSRMAELQRQQSDMSERLSESTSRGPGPKFYLEKTVEMCKDNGCRVLDYNKWQRCIAVTQSSANPLFAGYGIRKIDAEVFQQKQFILMHNKVIRDIAFHPVNQTLMLSVSFDKTAKIFDAHSNCVVHGYPTDSQLWSCCWSSVNSNVLLVGAQNGSITEFDIRQTSGAVGVHANPGDRSPVVSLATVPANSTPGINKGGFIAAHLNTCYAYEHKDVAMWTTKRMFLEGPFISVRYDNKNNQALISSRPNARQPNARHTLFTVDNGEDESLLCNVIHTFNGGTSQQLMSRPCFINLHDDTLVALHQESTKSTPLWSVATGKQIHSLPASDPVLDMCAFESNNKTILATLSGNKLRLYNHG